ncbi:hypothetical protein BXZ70DRAFT_570964 [Cristinia sonorae]|uniref:Domain of unknown function at the cortex 1 domain-containing protein n=1 Tax=Cristinia sonorae TaxID=1940300 RepID=A0A8K0UFC6_9AGAR|nr:hypothetical protein BXZ70DRAFT_570964 [Cristinia sonorae]
MPRLRVLAGPDFHNLTEIEVNSRKGFQISTDAFEGEIAVFLKGFPGEDGSVYFEREERTGKSWSIQFQGRFLQPRTADDVLVGAAFDRQLSLPWGFSAVTSFMQYRDPTLDLDLYSATPSALSPLVTSIPHLSHRRAVSVESANDAPQFPPPEPLRDDISQLADGVADRQAHFQDASRRKEMVFGPEDIITADFCHGHLDISSQGIAVQVPGGFSFDMMQYWDGKPVRFICCERIQKGESTGGFPWGRVFWCVALEVAQEESGENKSEEPSAQ